jgi:hypothetical protein
MKAIQSLRLRLHSGPSTLLRAERRRFARLFYGPTEVGPSEFWAWRECGASLPAAFRIAM